MTLRDLLALWNRRDDRYGKRLPYLSPEARSIVKDWRLREAMALTPDERRVAMVELARW